MVSPQGFRACHILGQLLGSCGLLLLLLLLLLLGPGRLGDQHAPEKRPVQARAAVLHARTLAHAGVELVFSMRLYKDLSKPRPPSCMSCVELLLTSAICCKHQSLPAGPLPCPVA